MTARKPLTPHDTFWLARRAYNRLLEPMKALRAVEPSAKLYVEAVPEGHPGRDAGGHIGIAIHWSREGMALYNSHVATPEDVEQAAQKLERFTEALRYEELNKAVAA